MRRWRLRVLGRWLLASWLLMGAAALPAQSQDGPEAPFGPGETLTYDLSWSLFVVGEAIMHVSEETEEQGGEDCHHLQLGVQTTGFADNLYKVRTKIDSWMNVSLERVEHYTKAQLEGKTHRNIVVNFDWKAMEAQYSNWDKPEEPIELQPVVFDPLAAMFRFRMLDLKEGGEYTLPITDGKKLVETEIKVEGIETIDTEAGEFECYVVVPDLRHVGGVFKKSPDAKMTIWISKDEHRLPVRLESEVKVGSFAAELTDYRIPGEE